MGIAGEEEFSGKGVHIVQHVMDHSLGI